jgi:hypothetical protein
MTEKKKDFVKDVWIWCSSDGRVNIAEYINLPNARITFSGFDHKLIKIEELK